jgi:hypothetical protein
VALYEVVLRRPSGRADVRVCEKPLPVDACFELDHITWRVVSVDYPVDSGVERRYICERANSARWPAGVVDRLASQATDQR